MMNTFSPRDRLTLVVGAAIIVSLMSASIGVPRYRAWRTAALGAATRETELLAQVEGSVARFNGTSALLAKARGELGVLDSLLLPGSTAAAGTSLAAAISDAAEGAEAQLGSIQVRQDSTRGRRLSRVAARATLSGDSESLALFLQSLEAGFPLLAVREWSISGSSTSIAPSQHAVLRMEVLVEGLARTPSETSAR